MADGTLDDVDRELSDRSIDPTRSSLAVVGEDKSSYKWGDNPIRMYIENRWKQWETMNDDELRSKVEEENEKYMVEYIKEYLKIKREITGNVFEFLLEMFNRFAGEGSIHLFPVLFYIGDVLDSTCSTKGKLVVGNNEINLTFDEPHVSKRRLWQMSLPYYLAVHKRYELLLALLKRVPEPAPRDDDRVRVHLAGGIGCSSAIERSIRPIIEHAACLDPTNEVLREILQLLFEQAGENKLQLAEHFVVSEQFIMYLIAEGKCPEYKTYIQTYFELLKETDEAVAHSTKESSRDKWGLQKHCIHWLLDYCVYRNKAESLRVILETILQSNVVSRSELNEIIAKPYNTKLTDYVLNTTIAERCLLGADNDTSICEVVFNTLEKDEIETIFTRERGTWLLTKIAKKESEEVVKLILDYDISLDEEYQQQLHEKLVEGSLPQKMILLMKKLTDSYIIPEGEKGAQKHALVYYNIRDRKDDGEKEANTVIKGLDELGFSVKAKQDWTGKELCAIMEEDINEVKNDCSILMVFLMAHGANDDIHDIRGESIKMEDIDDFINHKIREGIPKIFIVQACRVRKSGRKSNQTWEIFANNLTRHINEQDFGRFMTAARGERTVRNVMLPILMEELKKGGAFLDAWETIRERVKEEVDRRKLKEMADIEKEERELEGQKESLEKEMQSLEGESERPEDEMKRVKDELECLKECMKFVKNAKEMAELEENTLTEEAVTYTKPIHL